jgi:hypothetical protein
MGPLAPFMEKIYMMKKDKSFRLPKETKRLLATMTKEKRSDFKSLMIKGIILGSVEPPREKRKHKTKIVQAETEE